MLDRLAILAVLALLWAPPLAAQDAEWEAWEESLTEEAEATEFYDAPLEEEVVTPAWFNLTFLDLNEDLEAAREAGKAGLIVYFGQKYCPYCKALMEDLARPDVRRYTQRHFDVVAIDVHGDRTVTDTEGRELSEKAFSERERTNLTPSLLFYDAESGEQALKLTGYHPPYRFRAALEYVADRHFRAEGFRDYLRRADPRLTPREGELNRQPFFSPPPHYLDRSHRPGERPLVVFFEQADCHACDVLHSRALAQRELRELVGELDALQLDLWSDTPLVTPGGERTTARQWAEALGLFYTPTLLFFDRDGREILRLDSVAHFYRLRSVLQYVLSGAHERGITLQRWQRENRRQAPL